MSESPSYTISPPWRAVKKESALGKSREKKEAGGEATLQGDTSMRNLSPSRVEDPREGRGTIADEWIWTEDRSILQRDNFLFRIGLSAYRTEFGEESEGKGPGRRSPESRKRETGGRGDVP